MVTEKDIEQFCKQCNEIFKQVSRDVIGQKPVVEGTIIAMIAGGNVLLEGVPGVGKPDLSGRSAECLTCPSPVFSSHPI